MLIPVTNRKLRSVSYSVIPRWKKDRFIQHHIPETARDFGRAAKHKGINHPALGSPFPEYEKDDKDQDSKKVDQKVMAFHAGSDIVAVC